MPPVLHNLVAHDVYSLAIPEVHNPVPHEVHNLVLKEHGISPLLVLRVPAHWRYPAPEIRRL